MTNRLSTHRINTNNFKLYIFIHHHSPTYIHFTASPIIIWFESPVSCNMTTHSPEVLSYSPKEIHPQSEVSIEISCLASGYTIVYACVPHCDNKLLLYIIFIAENLGICTNNSYFPTRSKFVRHSTHDFPSPPPVCATTLRYTRP